MRLEIMSSAVCHESTEEACVAVCACPGVCFTRSTNCPWELKLPAEISKIAKPTQLRRSSFPCVSQVFEDSVIHTRRKRVAMGWSAKRCTLLPPVPAATSPCGNFTHSPDVCLFSASSFPFQYSTAYFLAYGFAQAI